ncbi:sigma-70 family RNA polymerase sigma factor [Myxococcota bacterium]|nr:sigma-70 family RNA polymerase sigma factor [Myxococcota bacterium]
MKAEASTGAHGVEDEELIRRFLDGDRSAYEALVRRHQDRVFSTCFRLLRDRAVAEEVAQDVFVNVYRNLHRFRGDSRFTTWLYRVAINHCKNKMSYLHRRQHSRHDSLDRPIELRGGEQVRRELPDPAEGADASLLDRELKEALERGIQALGEDQRTIVMLRDVEGLSYEEIGAALDLAEGTVKSRLHRARLELKSRLAGLLEGRGR